MGPLGNRGSWGPCPCPNSKKPMKKGTRGISWGPLLTPGPRELCKVHGLHGGGIYMISHRGRLTTHGAPGQ
ncbi:unnamed protein product [Staurois parvus]|uniref:Uncharacterized protein n=1 Tax=Staurois parvus TaxID=386267 RepID=A0ABN9E4R4_9NEOB|nr:unnamed protein product [Staurois parvus]